MFTVDPRYYGSEEVQKTVDKRKVAVIFEEKRSYKELSYQEESIEAYCLLLNVKHANSLRYVPYLNTKRLWQISSELTWR